MSKFNISEERAGYAFGGLREAFVAEAERRTTALSYPPCLTRSFANASKNYIDSLRKHRYRPKKAASEFGRTYRLVEELGVQAQKYRCAYWDTHDFVFTTPVRLEESVSQKIMAERKRTADEMWKARANGDNTKAEQLDKRIFTMSNFSIFETPSSVIATAYEIYSLRQPSRPPEYLKSYRFFDETLDEQRGLYPKGTRSKEALRSIQSYVRQLKRHAGDLQATAKIIARHLDYDTNRYGANSREFYVDPFYPQDMSQLRFPSAQADFVAARQVACSK